MCYGAFVTCDSRFRAAIILCNRTIADLVKHSGLAVIKSKEILQTLMKLELIHRDHEKSVCCVTLSLSSCLAV